MQQKSGQQQNERIFHFCIAVLIVYKKNFHIITLALHIMRIDFTDDHIYLFAIVSVYTCHCIYFITAVFACLQKDGIIDESCHDAEDTEGSFLMSGDCEYPL